jgi:glycosyltransferase involved in cell wall biosynthesis
VASVPAPRISVVIPTYNRAKRLAMLLDTLDAQDVVEPFEVIVCDDGSTDGTASMLQSRVCERFRLVYRRQRRRNHRAAQARNLGIQEARGDLLVLLDDDVLSAPDFLSEHVACQAEAEGPALVIGYRYRISGAPAAPASAEYIRTFSPDDRARFVGEAAEGLADAPYPWRHIYSCNLSLPRATPDLRFAPEFQGWGVEDIEFGYRMLKSLSLRFAPRAPVLHQDERHPRDPFQRYWRGERPAFDDYLRNLGRFYQLHRDRPEVRAFVEEQCQWYRRDRLGHWRHTKWRRDPRPPLDWALRQQGSKEPRRGRLHWLTRHFGEQPLQG